MTSELRAQDRVSTERLIEVRDHLTDGRQHQRGTDGFEVATFVLPMSPGEARSIINELIARRANHAHS